MKATAKLEAAVEIADAARKAYGNSETDQFFEEVIEAARHYAKVFVEADQQTRIE